MCAMRHLPIVLCLAACATPGPSGDTDDTVEAVRFRQLIVKGALDLMHGGGAWHDCLFLPQAHVVVQVVWEWSPPGWDRLPRVYAYRGAIEAPTDDAARRELAAQPPPETVRIPRDLADRFVELARIEEERRAAGFELGARCVTSRLVGDEASVKPRGWEREAK